MNDKDGAVMRPLNGFGDRGESTWTYEDSAPADSQPSGFAAELVSLRFITAALRRSARFWGALAVIGLVAGLGYKVVKPTPYQATTTVLLAQDAQTNGAIIDDATLAQSRAVASLVVKKLGLTQTPESVANSYTVTTPPGDGESLVIVVTAPSARAALTQANAVAAAFLKFRADLQLTEQNLAVSSLAPQASQARLQIQSLNEMISNLSKLPASAANQAKLSGLQTQLGLANNALSNATSGIQSVRQQTTLQIKDSTVLDRAVLILKPRKKPVLLAAAIGLFAGLVLGIGIVVVRAVVSDRLRQRDDVAHALGVAVKLSVGHIRLRRWMPGRPDLAAPERPEVRRVVAHLREAVPRNSAKPAALAVVPVDDPRDAALCVASLATSCAREGMRVVLADLTSGAVAGQLFGIRRPGVVTTGEPGAPLVLLVPDPADPAPAGPRPGLGVLARAEPARELTDACAGADLLLVLATVDPALGGDHLATWASDAVVVVTTGRSSWTKIHAAAEMLRLAGIRLDSGVLVRTDESDDSVGVLRLLGARRPAEIPWQVVADPYQG